MENVLVSTEIDIFVEAIRPYSIKEIGSKPWLEWHYRLQKLNQQMAVDISNLKEETVKETMISMDKVHIIVHEAIATSIWKCKILPLLLKIDPNPRCTFLLYSVLYHEASSVVLLESILYHPNACQALKDVAVDLIDYGCSNIAQLFVVKTTDSSEEVQQLRNNLLFDIGIKCISIIRYIAENMDQVEVSAYVRLYTTHDVPMLFAQLLLTTPWKTAKFKLHGNQQSPMTGKVGQTETQCWLGIRSLLLNPLCAEHYTYTSTAKDAIIKLIGLMNDNILDQISPLIELKQHLTRISVGGDVGSGGNTKRSIILEVIPQIQEQIVKECKAKWKEIAKLHTQYFFVENQEEIEKLASDMNEAYNVDLIEKLENLQRETASGKNCDGCGKSAHQKCSRCKQSWYCSRNCQVQHWPQHKNLCHSV